MENWNNECPTEILIDLKENNFMPSHVNYKEIQAPLDCHKSMKYLEDKENDLLEIKQEKYQCIMDMSPFRLKGEFTDPHITSNANSEQVSKQVVEDCPTAVLVDVPNSSNLCPKQYSALNNNKYDYCQEHDLVKCKCLVQDVKKQEYSCCAGKKYSAIDDSDDPRGFITMKNQLLPPRLHWKTPSPKSMSRISKEASKIIHNLNSSFFFDEDSLLCEEILPVPINFDNFDFDDNSDQEDLPITESSCTDKLSNRKSSVSIQTEEEVINSKIKSKEIVYISNSVHEDNLKISKDESYSILSSSELFDSQMNFKSGEDSNECNTSEQLKSLEIQTHYLNDFDFSACDEGTNDAFIKNSISSEDNENVLEKDCKEILSSKTLIKTAQKNSVVSKKKMDNNKMIRKLSNVKHSIESRNLPNNKENATPHIKVDLKTNSKEVLAGGKEQLKKTRLAMEPQTAPMLPRSNSFQCNSTRELISIFPKPHSIKQDISFLSNSEYKSSSSDVKHTFSQMRTPSKRYSLATPLKSASTKKPPLTPALSSFQNPSFPRFTPQSVGGTRFSFSKSWQQSNVSNSKGLRYQNSTSTSISSSGPKPSFSMNHSSKPNKQARCQSISTLSCRMSEKNAVSTSNKKRFCSKLSLPSPLLAEQDRKLARALFPSTLKK